MKRTTTILTGLLLLSATAFKAHAQQATSASGGEATGSGGTVSYTVGQLDYISASGSGGTISQGVQQPYQISVVLGVQEKGINLTCAIYPNPATDFVMLTVQKGEFQNMSYKIYDVKGQLIAQEKLSSASTTIPMDKYASALYLIKVFNNNNEVKSFKLIKNN